MEQVDAIVIGSGQGGVPLATDLARQGQKVVLFERSALGGCCVNYGCYPSKAFLASAHAAGQCRQAEALGIHAQVAVDFPVVMERVRSLVAPTSEGVERRLQSAGVRIVRAEAAFVGERTVAGGDAVVQAPLVVINTGKSPFIPAIPGLEGTPYLTYLNFWSLRELPPRILILGGGYIGVEVGQGMARLGSRTTIIERATRIASHEEAEVSAIVTEALAQDGVEFCLGVEVNAVSYADGVFTLTLSDGQLRQGEMLLVATGQVANTRTLHTEAAGIALDGHGNIRVDHQFRTTSSDVYAIGDVTGQPAFTHVSWEDYRRMVSILQGGSRTQGDRVLGYTFFTEPQVGRAGLTLAEAQRQGFKARAVSLPLEWVARAYLTGRTHGFYRLVVDEETDRILGATLVGAEAGELVHVIMAHMEAGSTWQVLERSVHIHPTYAEGLPSMARLLLEKAHS